MKKTNLNNLLEDVIAKQRQRESEGEERLRQWLSLWAQAQDRRGDREE